MALTPRGRRVVRSVNVIAGTVSLIGAGVVGWSWWQATRYDPYAPRGGFRFWFFGNVTFVILNAWMVVAS